MDKSIYHRRNESQTHVVKSAESRTRKLLSAAVTASLISPATALWSPAQADLDLYGWINNVLEYRKVGDNDSTLDVNSILSRFGLRYRDDLGNGLSATAQYEFQVRTDRELDAIERIRVATVGLESAYGSVDIGNQWSAYYDTVGTHIDPSYTVAYNLYSTVVQAPYRAANTIKYSNSFGPVYLELDLRLNDTDEGGDPVSNLYGGGGGIGVSYRPNDNLVMAAAFDSEDASDTDGTLDSDRMGFVARYDFSRYWVTLSWQNRETDNVDVDHVQTWIGVNFSDSLSGMLGYGKADDNAGTEPDQLSLGIYHHLGGGLRIWYEGTAFDADSGGARDVDRHILGLRLDF